MRRGKPPRTRPQNTIFPKSALIFPTNNAVIRLFTTDNIYTIGDKNHSSTHTKKKFYTNLQFVEREVKIFV